MARLQSSLSPIDLAHFLHSRGSMMRTIEQPHAQPTPAPEAAPRPTQRVLVVEDLEDTRTTLVELLRLVLKLEVDAAENGEQALALLQEKPYSLVVTDLRMPKVSGMKLIEEIQSRKL